MNPSLSNQELKDAFEKLGPWTTRFQIAGQTLGGSFEVFEDDLLMRAFVDRCPCPGRVLELGAMEGGRTFALARRVGHVVAVDARREHLRRARFVQQQLGVTNATFLELDLEACDLETLGKFDVAYNVGLFYHLAEPAPLLSQLARIAPAMFFSTHVADDEAETLVERGGYRGELHRENAKSDAVGGLRSHSFRPTRQALLRMLDDAGYHTIEVVHKDGQTLLLWCRTSSTVSAHQLARRALPRMAVIVTCHNYAGYLNECVRSVVSQSRRPDEVLVVDDASDDETPEAAARWADWGVRYLRVEHRDPRLARLAGLEATHSEFVCFLDADDRLSPDYLRTGLEALDRYDVGIVYSDSDCFGHENRFKPEPREIDAAEMSRTNFVHNGALIRREALEMTGALEVPVDSRRAHEDWLVWRRILEQGWKAKWQRGIYCYRFHDRNRSESKRRDPCYFDLRALERETITLFVALSGRASLWPCLQEFLEKQTWPHDQTRVVLLDTSQSDAFGRQVRDWLANCDYRDVRYLAEAVGEPGLADQERRERADVQDAVRLAAARIYNRMAREVTGQFVWIVEDDVVPPLNTTELLLRGFDEETASVAAPVPSRYHEGYVAWSKGHEIIRERGRGIQVIEGNGFGCVMLRTSVLKDAVFTCRQPLHYDFDPAFYERLKETGLEARLCWDAECRHLDVVRGEDQP